MSPNLRQKKPVRKTQPVQLQPAKKQRNSFAPYLILLLLLIISFLIYKPALNKSFINLDDDLYITENPQVKNFNISNIPSVFGETYSEQYAPLAATMMGIIYKIDGPNPYYFNLFSILIHLANILLVFFLVKDIFKNSWAGLAVAALFAFHPANVESICWNAASFKIGQYAFFFMLAMIQYLKYCNGLKIRYLIYSLVFFILSGFAKEQAVALILVVFLLDYFKERKLLSKRVILEKIPFLVIAIIFGIVEIIAITNNRSEIQTTPYSLIDKITLSAYGFTHYISKTIAPVDLWLHYQAPAPRTISGGFYLNLLSFVIFGLLCWQAVKKKNLDLVLGLGVFFFCLLFSLGLAILSIREVIVADRYLYLSIVGFGIILIALWIYIQKKLPGMKYVASGVFCLFLILLAVKTSSQVKLWNDSMSIMTNTIEHHAVPMAYNNRGNVYLDLEQFDKAIDDYNNAIKMDSKYYNSYLNRGIIYRRTGQPEKALADYNTTIRLAPGNFRAYLNRGNIYFDQKQDSLAMADYRKVLEMAPNSSDVYSNMGAIYARGGKFEEALVVFDKAIELKPNFPSAILNKAITLEYMKRFEEALATYDLYLRYKPDNSGVYAQKASIYKNLGRNAEAGKEMEKAKSYGYQPGQ